MPIIANNVVKMFITDTLLASTSGQNLKEYMMEKHGKTEEQYKKYLDFYLIAMTRLTRDEKILFSEKDIEVIGEAFKEDTVKNVL